LKQEVHINIYSANTLHIYIVMSVEVKSVQLALGTLHVLQASSFIIVFETLGKNMRTYQIFAFIHPLANKLPE